MNAVTFVGSIEDADELDTVFDHPDEERLLHKGISDFATVHRTFDRHDQPAYAGTIMIGVDKDAFVHKRQQLAPYHDLPRGCRDIVLVDKFDQPWPGFSHFARQSDGHDQHRCECNHDPRNFHRLLVFNVDPFANYSVALRRYVCVRPIAEIQAEQMLSDGKVAVVDARVVDSRIAAVPRPGGAPGDGMSGLRIGFGGVALLAGLAVLVLATTGPVGASTRLCRQLEAELVSAGNGGGGARARKYDDAIARQREQMAIAREQAKDAGCGFALLGRSVRQCAALNATIDRMGRNLDALQSQRGKMAGGGGKRSRAKVLAALEANGCRDEAVAERPRIEEPRETLAYPDEDGRTRTPLELMLEEGGPDEAPRALAGESYQTMCVRTCDGYFFPISYASTVSDFDRDQRNCETSCPGTDMQVFFGPSGVDEPASMVSTATGRHYSDLPTAFLHQQASVPQPVGCGCNPKKDFKVIAGTPPQAMSRPVGPVAPQEGMDDAARDGSATGPALPLPSPRPDPSASPAVAGTPEPDEIVPPFEMKPPDVPESSIVSIPLPKAVEPKPPAAAHPVAARPDAPVQPAERKVRVVGPAFLPDPEAATAPQAPDPTPIP
jgi:hypothetical protein